MMAVLANRWHRWLQTHVKPARLLRHVETLPLGPRQSLYLIECGGNRFLVAAGANNLSAPVPLQDDRLARVMEQSAPEGK